MALSLYWGGIMKPTHPAPTTAGPTERRPEVQQAPAPDAAETKRMLTRYVDPYDMRSEPQPEEPGYGHGV